MDDPLSSYRRLHSVLPDFNLAWQMREAGVDSFGRTGRPDQLPIPRPNRDQVLLRVDAIGICFSDVKLITQGSNHPRITGRNLAQNPVIPGHEVSLTVVEAGDDWKNDYKPGDRFIVQADVYFNGSNIAFGYVLPGGMQQYVLVGEPVLHGDEGSYLIPVKSDIGYAEAALVEPWTCVVAAYRIRPRKHIKPDGYTLIMGTGTGSYEIDASICAGGPPRKLVLAGVSESVKSTICKCEACRVEAIEIGKLRTEDIKPLVQERTGARGFDDIILLGTPEADMVEALGPALAKNGVMAIVASEPISRPVQVDIGRVHYDYIDYTGTSTGRASDAYTNSRVSELTPDGAVWFVGAAGPMGQMHVQRTVRMPNGPRKILCTDVDNDRLDYLRAGVAEAISENGIEAIFLNPMDTGPDALKQAIAGLTDSKGFDDIVVLAPVVSLIEESSRHLASGGLMNIFAGIPKGTFAEMDLSICYTEGNRFVGSSGSRPQDMVDTLAYTESGDLPTQSSMAAVGGIDAVADGVQAVKEARFPGKIVIFPHIEMPLTALTDLHKTLPSVHAKLKDGTFWTREAEEELLTIKLGKK